MTIEKAAREITSLKRFFRVLSPNPDVLEIWERIVTSLGISGKRTHDARLVAVMRAHSVSTILTFNTAHFRRFAGITVLDPLQI